MDLTGEGARRVGGRCNEIGVPAVYTAANVSLAALEVLVHLDRVEIPEDYVLMGIDLHETSIQHVAVENAAEISKARLHPVLRVSSVVIPREANYVLYPESPGLDARVTFDEPFQFDVRLFLPIRFI